MTPDFVTIGGKHYFIDLRKKHIDNFFVIWNRVFSNIYLAARTEAEMEMPVKDLKTKSQIAKREIKIHQQANKKLKNYQLPDFVFYDFVWRVLVKKGFVFKTPFRSKRKMRNAIRQDEYIDMINFISSKILKLKFMPEMQEAEKRTKGKKNKKVKGKN